MVVRMRFIFLTAHYRNKSDYGGQRSRFMHAAASKRSEVLTICPNVDSLSGEKIKILQNNPELLYISTTQYPGRKLVLRLISNLIYAFKASFISKSADDVIILNNNPIPLYLISGCILACLKKKYILDIRDIPLHKVYCRYPKISFIIKKIDDFILKRRFGSISVTREMKDHLKLNDKFDEVIELGSDLDIDFKSRKTFHGKALLSARLIYAGSINTYFDLKAFCDWLSENEFNGRLDYIGRSDCNGLEKSYPFFRNLGSMSKAHLGDALRNYDYGVFTSKFEVYCSYLLGNKIFDYISTPIPILYFGSCNTSVDKFIKRYSCGFSFQKDSKLADYKNQERLMDISGLAANFSRSNIQEKLETYFIRIQLQKTKR